MIRNFSPVILSAILLYLGCGPAAEQLTFSPGMQLQRSAVFRADTVRIPGADSLDRPVLTISGEGVTVDFNGAVLVGNDDPTRPDLFSGLAIRVENGSRITIKNLTVKGFKVALLAEGVDSLQLIDCDFSYNYRPRLKSIREREDLSDWLSYHQNDEDEWLRYGAGIYLKQCDFALVRNVRITGNQNGLLLSGCNDGLFYNNRFHFNSGLGIGLYRSSRNRVLHNQLDWNVRGYSHGFYERGQDSAGILCYEQSNDNVFAYNSATHSGDGFFLWAGQSTMNTGEGGCNGNLLFGNDFSCAPTNGIEVTFSSNALVGNRIEECKYGVWGGYSWKSLIQANLIAACRYGIAIEHGQDNALLDNLLLDDSIGIQLWERDRQPADWGYAQQREVASRAYRIEGNDFSKVAFPLEISRTTDLQIKGNQFASFRRILTETHPNERLSYVDNAKVAGIDTAGWAVFPDSLRVAPLPDGMDAFLPEEHLRGRKYILVDEWGPYDFRSPAVWLRQVEGDQYVFVLLGPEGNWKAIDGTGWTSVNPKTGTFPATFFATRDPEATELSLQFEFVGEESTDRFGREFPRGTAVPFDFYRYEKQLDWEVKWYNYGEGTAPLEHPEAFLALRQQVPAASEHRSELAYAWWDAPRPGIDPEHFATFASTNFEIEPGRYRLELTSDDGVKMWLDDQLIVDRWDQHVPTTDEVVVELGGEHHLEIAHFEIGGFATLSFRLTPADR